MTMLVAVSGGTDVLVLASDSAVVGRNMTGAECAFGFRPAKFYLLSDRCAAGTFGLTGTIGEPNMAAAAVEQCRLALAAEDGPLPVETVAREFAAELHRTFAELLRDIGRQNWPDPAGMAAGARPVGSFAGALVAGYGSDGMPEVWSFLVTADGLAELVCQCRGGPDRWGIAMTPGATAVTPVVYLPHFREVPRTLEAAAVIARKLIRVQADAPRTPLGPTVGGPVHVIGLTPGDPPRVLDLAPVAA